MRFPKKVTFKTYVLTIVSLAILLMATVSYVTSQGNNSEIAIEQNSFQTEASYIWFKEDSTYYSRNGTTGAIDYSNTNPTTMMQASIDAIETTDIPARIFVKSGYYDGVNINIYKPLLLEGEFKGDPSKSATIRVGTVFNTATSTPCIYVNASAEGTIIKGITFSVELSTGVGIQIGNKTETPEYETGQKAQHITLQNIGGKSVNGRWIDVFGYDVDIIDCWCYASLGANGYGLLNLDGGNSSQTRIGYVKGLRIKASGSVTGGNPIRIRNVESYTFQSCYIEGNDKPIVVASGENLKFKDSWMELCDKVNKECIIRFEDDYNDTSDPTRLVIEGCNFGCDSGYEAIIKFTNTYKWQKCVFQSNIWGGSAGTTLGNLTGIYNGNLTLIGNVIYSTPDTWVNPSAIGTAIDDETFVTENSGTSEASNDDWIPHGLTIEPTLATLTIEETDARYFLQLKATNSTHFQILLYFANETACTTDKTINWYAVYKP